MSVTSEFILVNQKQPWDIFLPNSLLFLRNRTLCMIFYAA